jgi:hypothetical protein
VPLIKTAWVVELTLPNVLLWNGDSTAQRHSLDFRFALGDAEVLAEVVVASALDEGETPEPTSRLPPPSWRRAPAACRGALERRPERAHRNDARLVMIARRTDAEDRPRWQVVRTAGCRWCASGTAAAI